MKHYIGPGWLSIGPFKLLEMDFVCTVPKSGAQKIAEMRGKIAEMRGKIAEMRGSPADWIFQHPDHEAKACLTLFLNAQVRILGRMSSDTLPRSTDTLVRGAGLLDDIASRGVIKHEVPEDELELQNQIGVSSLHMIAMLVMPKHGPVLTLTLEC